MSSTENPTQATDVAPLSEAAHETADRIVRRYPVARSALLPLLHLVQSEQNHITDEGIAFCAQKVGLTRAEVASVATFYTMYKRQPVGDWLLSVCTNPPCKIAGGQEIYDNYVAALDGRHSDPETKVTIEHAECLGICDGAPVVQVNYEMFGPMTVAEGDQLLAACRRGEPPVSPWSGEKPPTFAEVERDLSGANDAWEADLHRAALQQVAYDNPPTYRSGETDIPVTHPGGDTAGVGGALFRAAAAGDGARAHQDVPVDPGEAPVPQDTGGGDGDPDQSLAGSGAQRIAPGESDEPFTTAGAGTPLAAEVEVHPEGPAEVDPEMPPDAEAMTRRAGPGDEPGDVGVATGQTPGQPGVPAQGGEVHDDRDLAGDGHVEGGQDTDSTEGDAARDAADGDGYADDPDQAHDAASGAAATASPQRPGSSDESDVAPGEASAPAQSSGVGDASTSSTSAEGEPSVHDASATEDEEGA